MSFYILFLAIILCYIPPMVVLWRIAQICSQDSDLAFMIDVHPGIDTFMIYLLSVIPVVNALASVNFLVGIWAARRLPQNGSLEEKDYK